MSDTRNNDLGQSPLGCRFQNPRSVNDFCTANSKVAASETLNDAAIVYLVSQVTKDNQLTLDIG